MRNKLLTLFAISVMAFNTSAQECNCGESFDWMVSTFEKNDAGFQYVIDKKGMDDYKKHTALFKEKAKGVSTLTDCQTIMFDWLLYFRPGHIAVSIKEPSSAEIRLKYKNEKTIDLTEKQLIAKLEKKKNKNPIEGVWSTTGYKIGIIGDEKSNKKFIGFIIKADSIYWMPKQIKAEFTLGDDKTYSVDYYKRDHSKEATQAKFTNESGSIISIFNNSWVREYPKGTLSKKEEVVIKFSKAELPFIEQLSNKTIYLRIPSFRAEQKRSIDSVLAKYDKLITSIPNLIIDIRYGTGGADNSYNNIVPYLYTNPIRSVGIQLYATELSAKGFEGYAKQFSDTAEANYCNGVAKKMRANLGKFIEGSDDKFSIDSSYKVLPCPQKVAIICHQNNGSTDEQFLIDCKQSRKVKVFGRPTGGMLDISNMNMVDSPDGKFQLGYCMSRSYRIPNYCIDGVGIQPDYFIDDTISEDDWIEYTRTVLEQ